MAHAAVIIQSQASSAFSNFASFMGRVRIVNVVKRADYRWMAPEPGAPEFGCMDSLHYSGADLHSSGSNNYDTNT